MALSEYVSATYGSIYKVDGLCTNCFLPGLWESKVYFVMPSGWIQEAGAIRVCEDCRDVEQFHSVSGE